MNIASGLIAGVITQIPYFQRSGPRSILAIVAGMILLLVTIFAMMTVPREDWNWVWLILLIFMGAGFLSWGIVHWKS